MMYYDPFIHLRYENYNGVNVENIDDLPVDFMGHIGIPENLLDKVDKKMFKIIGKIETEDGKPLRVKTAFGRESTVKDIVFIRHYYEGEKGGEII